MREFDVIDVTDPLIRKPLHRGDINYYRLHGAYESGRIIYKHKYTDEELEKIAERVKEWNKKESYVYFNNVYMCDDAKGFKRLIEGQ